MKAFQWRITQAPAVVDPSVFDGAFDSAVGLQFVVLKRGWSKLSRELAFVLPFRKAVSPRFGR